MRLIKNFFHNINDVVLAIIIVAIAAGIIYWRMQVILDYPKQMAGSQTMTEETTEEAPAEEPAPAEEAAPAEEPPAEEAAPVEEAPVEEAAPEEAPAEGTE
ncbi:MAG: hypothetical protein IJH62_09405 [Mogibacterium sp.]|nr:hypothetical protein [Mogibacterium sp.]